MKKLLITIATVFLLLTLTACNSSWYVKRDVKRLEVLSLEYPNEFAILSNKLNPCFKEIAKSDTIIRHTTDTIDNSIERLVAGKPGKPDTLYLPGKTIRNNVYTTVHDTLSDNRALSALIISGKITADSLIIVKTQNTLLISNKVSLIKWVVGLSLILLSAMGVSIYKFLSGGVITDTLKKIVW
jgi:hypothetical protein